MKLIKVFLFEKWEICLFILLFLSITLGYPTGNPNLETQPQLRDEKRYPNGTIIGKYNYMDREGNPIQVKYYADENSYGVELKSLKVVDSTGEPLISTFQPINFDNLFKPTELQYRYPPELVNPNYLVVGNEYKSSNSFDSSNREGSKINNQKVKTGNPDYDIYYQSEVNAPKKCSNKKVRVYMDEKNRKVRNTVDHFGADKICEQLYKP